MSIPRPPKITAHLRKIDYQAYEDMDTYISYLENRILKLEGIMSSISEQCISITKNSLPIPNSIQDLEE